MTERIDAFVPEHNQAQIKDFTVPIFELQQKMALMEGMVSNLQAGLVSKLTESVASKINVELEYRLPLVHLNIRNTEKLVAQMERMEEQVGELNEEGLGGGGFLMTAEG